MAEHEGCILMAESVDSNIHTIFHELGFKEIDLYHTDLLGVNMAIYRDYLLRNPFRLFAGMISGGSNWAAFAWGVDKRSTAYKRYIKDPEKEG